MRVSDRRLGVLGVNSIAQKRKKLKSWKLSLIYLLTFACLQTCQLRDDLRKLSPMGCLSFSERCWGHARPTQCSATGQFSNSSPPGSSRPADTVTESAEIGWYGLQLAWWQPLPIDNHLEKWKASTIACRKVKRLAADQMKMEKLSFQKVLLDWRKSIDH